MGIKPSIFRFALLLGVFAMFFFGLKSSYAAGGTISIIPDNGDYPGGQEVDVQIKIDGGGEAFNASQATVTVPPIFTIKNLTLGDCDFALVRTPTVGNPSFAGVILGGSSKSCTIYTLTLIAQNAGSGNIILSNASIKAYHGATELLSSVIGGRYTVTGSSTSTISTQLTSPTQTPEINSSGTKQYNISYVVSLPKDIPISQVLVTLDPQLPTKISVVPSPESDGSKTIVATFQNVPEGVHTITTLYNDKALSSQIVNVTGTNKNLSFGASVKKPSSNWLPYVLIGIAILLLGIIAAALYWFISRKNSPPLSPPQVPSPPPGPPSGPQDSPQAQETVGLNAETEINRDI